MMIKTVSNDASSPKGVQVDKHYQRNRWLTRLCFIGLAVVLIMFVMLSGKQRDDYQTLSDEDDPNYDRIQAQFNALHRAKQTRAYQKQPTTHAGSNREQLARQHAPSTSFVAQQQPKAHAQNPSETPISESVIATRMPHPNHTIVAGELIEATLENAIHSDLPGLVRAVVTQPIYAYRGRRELIPQGSRLIGHYESQIVQSQQRIMVVWERLVRPDGISMLINSPSTDNLGRAGHQADHRDSHFFARFGEAMLLSIIGAGTSTLGVDSDDNLNAEQLYRAKVAESFQKTAEQTLNQSQGIQPTLHLHQGHVINVFVAKDIDFYPLEQNDEL